MGFTKLEAGFLCLGLIERRRSKCSHVCFNLLDARGAISVTERVGLMARQFGCWWLAWPKIYAEQQRP